jgi:UDP-N-acetylglucosamine 1-carboxyvinyltransferase
MDKIKIIGGAPLRGTIQVSGAKNAALPLIAAALATKEPLKLTNCPRLADVFTLTALLEHLGCSISFDKNTLVVHAKQLTSSCAPYDLVRKMRASVLILGPLLARTGHAEVSLPGGCAIGTRPVDLHLMGFEKMGAQINIENGYIHATAPAKGLQGADITFPFISVGATENLLIAASLAQGTTILRNAATEPEVVDLTRCLQSMGAKIDGIGTSTLTITGVPALHGTVHSIIPDRIESGSYAVAAALTGGELHITNTSLDLLPAFAPLLRAAGVSLTPTDQGFMAKAEVKNLQGVDLTTAPYPGYPTDLQAQFMALMTLAQGQSNITENIFENRFMHVPELARMGAQISLSGRTATVTGVTELKGAPVMATDLRASVSLVIAALAAQGESVINRIYHLDRGYEGIENKLKACGANIERITDDENRADRINHNGQAQTASA